MIEIGRKHKGKITDTVRINDITSDKDDPYNEYDTTPSDVFREILKENGCTDYEIYHYDMTGEGGILVDYDLLHKETLTWNKKEKCMDLKLKYPLAYKFINALDEMGIYYDPSRFKIFQ